MSFTSTYPTNFVKLAYAKRVFIVSVSDLAKGAEALKRAVSLRRGDAGKGAERPAKAVSKPLRDAGRGLDRLARAAAKPLREACRALEKPLRNFARRVKDAAFGDYGFKTVLAKWYRVAVSDLAKAAERLSKLASAIQRDAGRALDRLARAPLKAARDAARALDRLAKSAARFWRDASFGDYGFARVPGKAFLEAVRAAERAAKLASKRAVEVARGLDRAYRALAKRVRDAALSDFSLILGVPIKLYLRDVFLGTHWPELRRRYVRSLAERARAVERGASLRFRLLCEYVRTVLPYDVVLAADHNALKRVMLCAVEKLKSIRTRLGA